MKLLAGFRFIFYSLRCLAMGAYIGPKIVKKREWEELFYSRAECKVCGVEEISKAVGVKKRLWRRLSINLFLLSLICLSMYAF